MNNLRYSNLVLNDLGEIKLYITTELNSPLASKKIADEILQKIEKLQSFPYMGSELNAVVKVKSDFRYLVCGNYIAFYHVVDINVFIDRIIYKKRDFIKILFKD